jgi:hypothetical protein
VNIAKLPELLRKPLIRSVELIVQPDARITVTRERLIPVLFDQPTSPKIKSQFVICITS